MYERNQLLYKFGPFCIQPVKRLMFREDEVVPVTSKVFDLMLILIEHSGKVLSKDEIMKRLWPDTIVEENNLTQQISLLRKALGERAGEQRYIVTVPGRGYSFVADVREVRTEVANLLLQQRTESSLTIDVEEEPDEPQLSAASKDRSFLSALVARGRYSQVVKMAFAILGMIAGLTATVLYYRFANTRQQLGAIANVKSIAVLPFKSLSANPEDGVLGPGMTDTLIAKLSNLHTISVRPTSSVIKYVGTNADTRAAGRELKVDAVLEGTVQRVAERVRVTVQFVRVEDGKPLWAESFDEQLDDIFGVQDTISARVAEAMLARINSEERERLAAKNSSR